MFPLLEGPEFADLVEDIRKNGLQLDIDMADGKIIDGRNRARACIEAGERLRFTEQRFKSDAGIAAFIISRNIHRRHLTAEQKRDLIAKLLATDPAKSDRQIAKTAGVSHPTVARVRIKMEESGDVEKVSTSIDTKGRAQTRRRLDVRPAPGPALARSTPKSILPKGVVLNSLLWSEASPELKRKFVSQVGLANLIDAAPPDQKAAYLAKACAAHVLPKKAERREPVTASADDGLNIPDYLRRVKR
jgi:hypothetical protein